MNSKVAPRATLVQMVGLCSFIILVLFIRIIRKSVIRGIIKGLSACEAINIQTGLPPKKGTINPDSATKTTISLYSGLFMLRSVPV